LGERIGEEERPQIKRTIKDTIIYVENSNREKSRSHTQIHYIIGDYMRRKESLLASLCLQWYTHLYALHNPNGDASFIGKTRLTSYEITKLLLTRVPRVSRATKLLDWTASQLYFSETPLRNRAPETKLLL